MKLFKKLMLIMIISSPASCKEASPLLIGTFGKWSAYELKEAGKKICYMVSHPTKQEGDFKKRGQVYAMITHRPAAKSFNVVSFHAGYQFSPGASVDVTIGKDSYTMMTEKESAWTNNETDGAIVNSIKKGETIVVSGKSAKGTATVDTYSLKGSTQAYQAISKTCGLQ